ncbi:MAG: hypothetical protein RLZZ366_2444 [Pseudomonadota bacterium]
MFDTGDGVARNIGLMSVPMRRIDGVFLSHFHSDHIDGWGPEMTFSLRAGSSVISQTSAF